MQPVVRTGPYSRRSKPKRVPLKSKQGTSEPYMSDELCHESERGQEAGPHDDDTGGGSDVSSESLDFPDADGGGIQQFPAGPSCLYSPTHQTADP